MAHGRSQIRAAIQTALAGLTTGTLYVERAHRLDPALLPAILLRMGDDSAQADQRVMPRSGGSSYTVERDQTVNFELHAWGQTGADVAALIDDMDEELEQLIAVDPTLGGLVEILTPAESSIEMNEDQDRVLGVRAVAYVATWRHDFGAPETPEG